MTPNFVEANGVRFAYLEEGTGPLVLLVHGFPDTALTWDRVLPAVARAGYRAIAPWTRGYAPTALAPDGKYDTDTLARDVIALVEQLSPDGTAILVGHDWGASATYGAAALAPERVKLLVTLGIPHPASMKPTPSLAWKVRHFVGLQLPGAAKRVAKNDFAKIDDFVARWSAPGRVVPPDETAAVKAAFRDPAVLDAALGYYRTIGVKLPSSHRMPITVPTVAFAGTEDQVVAPRIYEKARKMFTASYEVVQVPGGHFMHREHPDDFIPELVRVLHDHVARSGTI